MSDATRAEMLLGRVIGDVARGLRDLTYSLEERDPPVITIAPGQLMRKAADLVGVLASAVQRGSALEAMGAPGDWGYGDPIGDCLLAALHMNAQSADQKEVLLNRERIRKTMELLYPLLGDGCLEAVTEAYQTLQGPPVEHADIS